MDDKKEAVMSKVGGAKDTVTGVVPDRRALKRGATHMRETAASNPLGLAVGGLALGFLVGTLLPRTRVENQQMGEMSDRLVEAGEETQARPSTAVSRSRRRRRVRRLTPRKESGCEQGEELTSALQDRTQE